MTSKQNANTSKSRIFDWSQTVTTFKKIENLGVKIEYVNLRNSFERPEKARFLKQFVTKAH